MRASKPATQRALNILRQASARGSAWHNLQSHRARARQAHMRCWAHAARRQFKTTRSPHHLAGSDKTSCQGASWWVAATAGVPCAKAVIDNAATRVSRTAAIAAVRVCRGAPQENLPAAAVWKPLGCVCECQVVGPRGQLLFAETQVARSCGPLPRVPGQIRVAHVAGLLVAAPTMTRCLSKFCTPLPCRLTCGSKRAIMESLRLGQRCWYIY